MTQQPPANPYASTPNAMRPEDEKTWAILTHVGGLFIPVVAPLVIYLVLRDRGPFIRHHSATALNFHLTIAIAYLVGLATSWLIIGIFVMIAAAIVFYVLGIIAAISAGRGEFYTYPMTIAFLR
ncbi:MAG: DUF4870 domain-containing protein [Microcella sp.]|uniref:DUF4870 domain-containing protein n=1 Tax=Microcella sp. TaxID=1913979 RepID=UPI002727AC29|nr:DUF4870 domain-containing protein [Microcella sp.]MDO8337340.1 DUF4870 domain-containing protein [Microcella sp.]